LSRFASLRADVSWVVGASQVTYLFRDLSRDNAGPFLSDRECSPRISPADGVDGILNVKPMNLEANSWQGRWSYVEVRDVEVDEVVVEGEERGWCSANIGAPFIRLRG
jgi:hypothetical protein